MAAHEKPQPTIQTQRLVIRPYEEGDWEQLNICMGESGPVSGSQEVMLPETTSDRAFSKTLLGWHKHAAKGEQYVFGAFAQQGAGEWIGQADVFLINRQLNWFNFGMFVRDDRRRAGFALEMASAVLQWVCREVRAHRVEIATDSSNDAVHRLAARLGFEYEGIRRGFLPWRPDVDMAVFGATCRQFSQLEVRHATR